MHKTTFREFAAPMEDLARTIARAGRRGARTLAAMPWPAMLGWCIALAIVLTLLATILPLALFLFAVFMALKLAIVGYVTHTRRSRRDDYKL
jgi:hypothetical protein